MKNLNDNIHINLNSEEPITTDDIIQKIDYLVRQNENLNKTLIELSNKNLSNDDLIKQLKQENKNLQNEIQNLNKTLNKTIKNIQNEKDLEIENQKKLFYDKIRSLSQLLEESNQLMLSYEKEMKELKSKNQKLHYNIKMLTDSNDKLNEIVNNNNDGLKNEIDIKNEKYNNLLKEVQLKDVQIQSLEKLIQQNPDLNSKMNYSYNDNNVNNINIINSNINPLLNSEQSINKTTSFVKDEEIEKGLNKMINNFNENEFNTFMGDNYENNNSNFILPYNEENIINNNNQISRNTSKKIPGKIYSIKQNINQKQ